MEYFALIFLWFFFVTGGSLLVVESVLFDSAVRQPIKENIIECWLKRMILSGSSCYQCSGSWISMSYSFLLYFHQNYCSLLLLMFLGYVAGGYASLLGIAILNKLDVKNETKS